MDEISALLALSVIAVRLRMLDMATLLVGTVLGYSSKNAWHVLAAGVLASVACELFTLSTRRDIPFSPFMFAMGIVAGCVFAILGMTIRWGMTTLARHR